jgi:hypothetical protein
MRGLSDVLKNTDGFKNKAEDAALAGAMLTATQMQYWARANRNWKDRTGIARSGLIGSAARQGSSVKVAIAHTPHYGVFLELGFAGRFAVLDRAAYTHGQKFLTNVKTAMGI